MIYVQHIDNLDSPELAPYLTMRRQIDQREQGIFVAESDKVVRRLLESTLSIVSVLLPEKWYQTFEPLLAKRSEDIQVYLLEKHRLETLSGFTFYQGVLAVGKVPPAPKLETILSERTQLALFTAVEGITNAENLGGIVRSCAAFGGHGVLMDRTSCSPYLRRAVRSSMGTIFRMPALEGLDLVAAIRTLRAGGVRCIAAHPHTSSRTIADIDFGDACCVVLGSEGYGISPPLLAACDDVAKIPMADEVDSLNVGNAAAVFFYEANRQRRLAGGLNLKRK